jgi:hypothetical protein
MRDIRSLHCDCTVEVYGLYFYPKKFGIKFGLRSIKFYKDILVTRKDDDGDISMDGHDVEEEWREEVHDTCQMIEEDERVLQDRLRELAAFKTELHSKLEGAKSSRGDMGEWNATMESLRTMIFKYKTGRLM